jgi:glycerol-3-phosphate acyltransferase PlsX
LLDTALRQIEKRFGEAAQSGARLLGVNGIVMVGHGSSHAISITNALIKAHEVVSAGT